jgi:DNA-binding response OmpR family regulator
MKRILVAEDTKELQQILVEFLASEGYDVIAKDDGLQAYQWLQENPLPDLLITDMMMPNMNGMDLIEKIRENKDMFDCLPIMVYSASPQFREKAKALSCLFVNKPFDMDPFMATVEKLIYHKNKEVANEKKSETST